MIVLHSQILFMILMTMSIAKTAAQVSLRTPSLSWYSTSPAHAPLLAAHRSGEIVSIQVLSLDRKLLSNSPSPSISCTMASTMLTVSPSTATSLFTGGGLCCPTIHPHGRPTH